MTMSQNNIFSKFNLFMYIRNSLHLNKYTKLLTCRCKLQVRENRQPVTRPNYTQTHGINQQYDQYPSISCFIGPDSDTTRGTLGLFIFTFIWLSEAEGVFLIPVEICFDASRYFQSFMIRFIISYSVCLA
jgi:hypothetical protein